MTNAMSAFPQPRILLCGDTALSVEFGNRIDPAVNAQVQRLFKVLKEQHIPGILGLIPTYRALLIQYDPWTCSYERLLQRVEDGLRSEVQGLTADSALFEIPVCYGSEYGPDLAVVAAFHKLLPERVIELHSQPLYSVFMLGFTPGFPYLGGLDERLVTPRRQEPRSKVPAGSVGIADQQTGIYSLDSPGGWQLIGRTPMKLFDLARTEPFLLKPGDRVKFKPIARDVFGSA
jgi:inhibitor of KinA